ncbi:hypothetical protein AO242_14905 [Pseudomonas sp. ICMP 561]|nr:hypothetical protein AO242_14905 [Pseudomonas sp. ICMP 561]
MFDLKAATDAFMPLHCHATNINSVGANSFAKAVCQAKMLFSSAFFANEFAPTESPTHSRASLAPTGSKHA